MPTRHTPYHQRFVELGAEMGDRIGFDAAVVFTSTQQEHMATRGGVGLYDVYYQGPIDIKGPDAQALLDHVLARDVPRRMATDGQVLYSSVCNESGGMIDDLTAYRLGPEHYWLVATPSRAETIERYVTEHARERRAYVTNCISGTAYLSVQGPGSRELLAPLAAADLSAEHLPYFRSVQTSVAEVPTLVSRTGYSGELGFELYYPRDYALHMWDALTAAGATPCGLGALRSTRMEKKYPLYGLDVSETTSPLEAGLAWAVDLDAGPFVGRDALARQRDEGISRAPHRDRAPRPVPRARRRRRGVEPRRRSAGDADIDGQRLVPGEGARDGVPARGAPVGIGRDRHLARRDHGRGDPPRIVPSTTRRVPMFARRSSQLLALALIGSALVSGPASAATPVDLRVMEFNIEYGGTVVSFDSIVRAVQAADADVVGVEEGFGNVPRLADALGYPYYNVRLQVISRLPLIDAPGGNGLYLFVETAPGQVVALANVHLPAGPYSPNLVRRGAKRSTILEIERRVRVPAVEPAVTALTGLVDRGIPGLLLGDFNTPSRLDWTPETVGLREQIHYPVNWPTSRFVEDAGFQDSYRVAHPDPVANPGLTWPSGRPRPPGVWSPGPNAPADRIDFIYTAGDVQTLGSDVVGESGGPDVTIAVDPWGTDHRAVVSELSVQGGVLPTLVAVGSRLIEAGTDQMLTFHGPGGPDQHLAVIPAGGDPADPIADEPVAGEVDGTVAIATDGWDPGTYVALLMDGSSVRSRTRFWIEAPGDGPHVSTSRHVYGVGDPVAVHWWNAPGARWDWIGVYPRHADPNVASYLTWFYTRSTIQGSGTLDADSEGPWPLPAGRYSVYLLADDGYQVLARHAFRVR